MFKNTTKTLFVLLAILAMPILLAAQTKFTLKGKVTDAAAEGLIGVNVMVGGTFFGTATDLDGNYQIEGKLKEGEYDAVFSYVGFGVKSAKFTVGSGDNMITTDMQMAEDRMKMDEVVVTGSSVQSTRRQLGNAFATVSGDDIAKSGTGNALAALAGRVPGARITQTSGDPAGGINVNLRGINSIRGGSDPLYVIDGVIVSNSSTNVSQTSVDAGEASIGTNRMADLNPNDIESVNVINGAAAAAIYGSRAANGVVLITTKRGVAGKAKITVGSSFTMNQLRKRVYISTYGKQFGSDKLALNTIASVTNQAPFPGAKFDTLVRNGANQILAKNLVDVTRYDYQDDIFQDATGTDNFVNVAGGNDKTRYFVGVTYMKNGGIIKNTDFTRYGVRLNLDQQLASWASLSLGINYTNSYSNEKPNGNVFFSPINGMTITGNIYDINSLDGNGNYKAVDPGRVNPNSVINTFVMNQRVNRTTNNLKLSLYPLQGLKLDIIAGIDAFSQLGTQYIPVYTYTTNTGNKPTGFAGTANNLSYLFNNDVNLSYDKKFGKFSSSTTLGYNYQYQRVDFTNSFGEGLAPGITTVNASAARQTAYAVDRFDVKGFFAQETFGYNNNLFLTAAYRLDNSSKFSKDLGYQGYKKLSLSYILSDLWAKNTGFTKILNTAKLRASYGESGGLTGIGSYDRFKQVSSLAYLAKNTLLPSATLANAQVKPERTTEIEFGADLGLLDNRITLGATYYDQKVADLLVNRTIAASQGGTSLVDNVGTMTNSGIELSVNVNPIRTKNFNWDIYGVFNNNKNKITKLGSPFILLSTVSGAPAYLIEGQPTTVFFGTYYAKAPDGSNLMNKFGLPQTEKGIVVPYKVGDAILPGAYIIAGSQYVPQRNLVDGQPAALNTKVKVGDKDYVVSELRKVIGNPNPKYTLTMGTNLRFKGLTFGFMLDGVYGNQVFNADKRTRQGVGIGNVAEQEYKGEVKRGYINAIYPIEEWRIDDGAFTKIREVSLSYNFGKMIKGLTDFTISATGRNLYSFDNYNGYDPETNAGGTSDLLRGIDFGNIPIPRSFQFGVRATF